MKTALKYLEYSLAIPPIKKQIMFPGNIAEGITSEVTKKIEKKTVRIHVPFILFVSKLYFPFNSKIYETLIFNKHFDLNVEHLYKN